MNRLRTAVFGFLAFMAFCAIVFVYAVWEILRPESKEEH